MPIFEFLVFLAAFSIEGIGTYISTVGLSSLFASDLVIIILAIALDFAKVVNISFLYKFWAKINLPLKIYMTLASIVLVVITSTGAFGFLSGKFQTAIADTGTQAIKIKTLEEEKGRLQKRKEEIDTQIAKLPDNFVRGRTQLIKQFGPEVTRINARLASIDKELPELKIENVGKELHVGPIIYVAKAFNTTPDEAVKWVILTIIFVFDPLAIALLIAGNFLMGLRLEKKAHTNNVPMPEHISANGRGYTVDGSSDKEQVKKILEQITSVQTPLPPTAERDIEVESSIQPISKKHIKVEEREGRDVISLEEDIPQSSLESLNTKNADITPDDSFSKNLSSANNMLYTRV